MTDSPPQGAPAAASTSPPTMVVPPAVPPSVQASARWFWWIAGLSLVNIVMLQSGTHTSFVVGLGMTVLSDAVFSSNKPVGFLVDAVVLGFFFLMGDRARRGALWAFYVGLAVYAIDTLIYLRVQDWMPVAFHALVIYFLSRGVMALRAAAAARA